MANFRSTNSGNFSVVKTMKLDMGETLTPRNREEHFEEHYSKSRDDLRKADIEIDRLCASLKAKCDEIDNFKKENSELKETQIQYEATLKEKCAMIDQLNDELADEGEKICELNFALVCAKCYLENETEEKLRLENENVGLKSELENKKLENLHLQNELQEAHKYTAELKNDLENTEKTLKFTRNDLLSEEVKSRAAKRELKNEIDKIKKELENLKEKSEKETSRLLRKISQLKSDKEKVETEVSSFHVFVKDLKSTCDLNEVSDDVPMKTQLKTITEKLSRHFESLGEAVTSLQTAVPVSFRTKEPAFNLQTGFMSSQPPT